MNPQLQYGAPADVITLNALLAPLVERWRRLLAFVLVVCAITAAALIVRRPRYDAEVVMATVSSSKGLGNLGGAAALLAGGLGSQGGFQVTPALVAELLKSRRVLTIVGQSFAADGRTRIADQIAEKPVPLVRIPEVMNKVVRTSVDRETGLVSLDVVYTDSATARLVTQRLVDQTTRAFVETARAQATEQRRAQEMRVDSASRQLQRAQAELAAFASANRMLSTYSPKTLERQQLERNAQIAQEVYTQAMSDREAAVAKELEETPVVVVVDPLPSTLPRKSRMLSILVPIAGVVAGIIGMVLVFIGEAMRRRADAADPDAERLRRAIDTLPFVRPLRRLPASTGKG